MAVPRQNSAFFSGEPTVGEPRRRPPRRDRSANSTLRANLLVNGMRQTLQSKLAVSCLDENVPVRLASGRFVPIEDIVVGGLVYDSVTGENLKVARVIWGTEANEKIYRLGFGHSIGLFTAQHPITAERGLVRAAAVRKQDDLLGADGAYHPVTTLEVLEGSPARFVYNLEFGPPGDAPKDHLFVANGIVVGDNDLQHRLQPPKPGLACGNK